MLSPVSSHDDDDDDDDDDGDDLSILKVSEGRNPDARASRLALLEK